MPQAQTYQSEFTGQEMDARFAAVAQLTAALEALTAVVAQKYVKPASGIPSTDMDADVQAALAKANTAVQSLADYYTKSEVDQLLAAINGMDYVDVATLPTASAETLGKIYLVGPDGSGYYAYYYTSYDGSAYSWVGPLGTTQISLANYATKAELSQLEAEVNGTHRFDVTTGERITQTIGSDGKWSQVFQPDTATAFIVPITPGEEYTFINNADGNDIIAFLKTNSHSANTTADFSSISGFTSRITVSLNTNVAYTAPSDANYLFILAVSSSQNRLSNVYTHSETGIVKDIENLQEEDGKIHDEIKLSQPVKIDPATGEKLTQSIDSSGIWSNVQTEQVCRAWLIPIVPGEDYKFVNNSSGNGVIAFLKGDSHTPGDTADFSDETGYDTRIIVPLLSRVTYTAPEDANLLYILDNSAGSNRLCDIYGIARINGAVDGLIESVEKTDTMLVYPVTGDSENLSIKINNNENTAWTWWFYPQLVSLDTWRKKAWWGFTDNNGYVGVCEYDAGIKTHWKNLMKFSSDSGFGYLSDDHNNSMVCILPDGKIGTAFASGHEKDERVFVRKSKMPYSIYDFDAPVEILFGGKTTYIQYFYVNGKHYLFVRCTMTNHYEWQYSESTDFVNWSVPSSFLVAGNARYYMDIRKVTGSNLLRLVCYGHPIQSTDSNIRMGFIDLANNKILDADASTIVASFGDSFNYSDLSVIVPVETGKVNRLFDVAVTDISTWKVAYAVFTKEIKTDSVYKVSINGVVNSVCQGGVPFWTASAYLGGVSFLPDGRVVVSRNDTTYDYIEIYSFAEGAWGIDVEIWKEAVGATPIRNIRPIVDANGLFVVWQRGRFTDDAEHSGNYDLDSMVYDLTD